MTSDNVLWQHLVDYTVMDQQSYNHKDNNYQFIIAKRVTDKCIAVDKINATPLERLIVVLDNETNYVGPKLFKVIMKMVANDGKFGD